MECLLCGHEKAHKHGKTTKGVERYECPNCGKTFPENLETGIQDEKRKIHV